MLRIPLPGLKIRYPVSTIAASCKELKPKNTALPTT